MIHNRNRTLIRITDLLDIAPGNPREQNQLWREVRGLVDDLNNALTEWEISIIHLDTEDYVALVPPPGDSSTPTIHP